MVTESQVEQFLNAHPVNGDFKPHCYISEVGDALNVYFDDAQDYSERLTDHVTLFRSVETNDVVGCRIKGISGILEDLPNYIEVNHDDIALSVIFLAARDKETSTAFNSLAKTASEKKLVLHR